MKKLFLIVLMLVAISMAATAQNKKIAILETVDKKGDVPYGVLLQLRSNLTYAISNTPGYEGYDRVDMAQIMGEHNFQRTGVVSDEQIRKLGEMTGCSSILVAEAAVYDKDNIIITAKILNVETASVEKSVPPQISSTNPKEMQKACMELAEKLIVRVSGASVSTPSDVLEKPKQEKPKVSEKPAPIDSHQNVSTKNKVFFGINFGLGLCKKNYASYFGNDSVYTNYSNRDYNGFAFTGGFDLAFPITDAVSFGISASAGYESVGTSLLVDAGPLLLVNIKQEGSLYLGGGLCYSMFPAKGPSFKGYEFRIGYKFKNRLYLSNEVIIINGWSDSGKGFGDIIHIGYSF